MKLTFKAQTSQHTIRIGEAIGSILNTGDVVALSGELGAGKTTLTKGIAKALDVQEEITSPTFCIVSEYEGRFPLRHIDLYRLSGVEDFEGIGGEELFWQEGVCVLEWSERIKAALPASALLVHLAIDDAGEDSDKRMIDVDNISEQAAQDLAKAAGELLVPPSTSGKDTAVSAGGSS